ncbi:DUF2934 domain-containing protein [Sphingomonas xinjiangensis]|uniref:Putative membrane protein n=1 Tax=Sphingomonas xinjiangensis TaxID=643568 RepID=A0A840YQ86_9SPHN|nr:DUF2934 domain-containing protein [Sphingomonas xinjiangensis]MBB5710921.1 putative membrane protein [Sphingomonas xinjiangensis]
MNDDREHKVRQRAYALWESEGRPSGRHEEHWRQAHSEVTDTAPPSQTQDRSEAAAQPATAAPAASSRAPVAASPTAADTPAAVEQATPAPRKKRAVKPKA